MFLPGFIFEDSDILELKSQCIFIGEYTDKLNNFVYYKLSPIKFKELINIIYSNYKFGDRDIQDVEFDLRIMVQIFTAIINRENSLTITSLIIQYHAINSCNAKKLMTVVRRQGEEK